VASRPQTLAEIELAFERSRHRASARHRAPRRSVELALSAYDAGPAAVERAGGAPTIATLRYVKNIEAREPSLLGC
jgi:hypothetical protein